MNIYFFLMLKKMIKRMGEKQGKRMKSLIRYTNLVIELT